MASFKMPAVSRGTMNALDLLCKHHNEAVEMGQNGALTKSKVLGSMFFVNMNGDPMVL